jgi:hypothetical protein
MSASDEKNIFFYANSLNVAFLTVAVLAAAVLVRLRRESFDRKRWQDAFTPRPLALSRVPASPRLRVSASADYSTAVGIRVDFWPALKLPPLTLFAFLADTDLAGRLLTFLAGFFPFFATMNLSPFASRIPAYYSAKQRSRLREARFGGRRTVAAKHESPRVPRSRTWVDGPSHPRLPLNDDFHSAILRAPGRTRVVGDWLRCSVAVDLDPIRRDAARDEDRLDRFRAEVG